LKQTEFRHHDALSARTVTAVGSSLGFVLLLRSLGKQAEVIASDGIPAAYMQLPGCERNSQSF
jgi:hypothetical protein